CSSSMRMGLAWNCTTCSRMSDKQRTWLWLMPTWPCDYEKQFSRGGSPCLERTTRMWTSCPGARRIACRDFVTSQGGLGSGVHASGGRETNSRIRAEIVADLRTFPRVHLQLWIA